MIRRATPVVAALLVCSGALLAQAPGPAPLFDQTITLDQLRSTGAPDTAAALTLYRPDLSAANGLISIHGMPALTLFDGRRVADSSFLARMGLTSLDLFPVAFLKAIEVQSNGASPMYGADATGGVVNLRLNRNYTGTEVGLFYGTSLGGKFHRDEEQAYFISGIGNDKTQITVGGFYERSSLHSPRVSGSGFGP